MRSLVESNRSADMVENVEAAGTGKEGEARRRRPMEVPAELDSRFLRVGDKLYRSAHDKQPVATITPDRIKAKDPNSLPDLIRLAKENGWKDKIGRASGRKKVGQNVE